MILIQNSNKKQYCCKIYLIFICSVSVNNYLKRIINYLIISQNRNIIDVYEHVVFDFDILHRRIN